MLYILCRSAFTYMYKIITRIDITFPRIICTDFSTTRTIMFFSYLRYISALCVISFLAFLKNSIVYALTWPFSFIWSRLQTSQNSDPAPLHPDKAMPLCSRAVFHQEGRQQNKASLVDCSLIKIFDDF